MRIAVAATAPFGAAILEGLANRSYDIELLITRPDKPQGRGRKKAAPPAKEVAKQFDIPVEQPDRLTTFPGEARVVVVAGYGVLIPEKLLSERLWLNVHPSLLPRWRGAAPVERAILAGDDRTGVDLMVVEEGLDTGGVLARAEVPIAPDDDLESLRATLVAEGTRLLLEGLGRGLGPPVAQEGEPVYAAKLEPHEHELDWGAPAVDVHRRVRVGGAWTTHRGRRLKVHRANVPPRGDGPVVPAADGGVELVEVQPEGKGRLPAADWARGARWSAGDRLPS
jgi:methionyl-tRNA formyltransferase